MTTIVAIVQLLYKHTISVPFTYALTHTRAYRHIWTTKTKAYWLCLCKHPCVCLHGQLLKWQIRQTSMLNKPVTSVPGSYCYWYERYEFAIRSIKFATVFETNEMISSGEEAHEFHHKNQTFLGSWMVSVVLAGEQLIAEDICGSFHNSQYHRRP